MKSTTLLLIFVFSVFGIFAQESYSIGERHTIESKNLAEKRILNIHLPLNFSKDSIYPVMYVLDGSAHEDFLHIVGLVQFFQLQFGAPEMILVGIENVDRKRDFTYPPNDKSYIDDVPTAGHSDKFISFMKEELQPFIESNFKTTGQKFIVGQSLGGLMASEFLLKTPDLFTHYLIVSPSLWWDGQSMLKNAEDMLKKQSAKPKFIYLAVGADEHIIMRRDAKALNKVLKKSKAPNQKLYFNKMKGENHATILHNALYQGLEQIYPFVKPE